MRLTAACIVALFLLPTLPLAAAGPEGMLRAADCDANGLEELVNGLTSGEITPRVKPCFELDGHCTISEAVRARAEVSWWAFAFLGAVEVDASVDVTTTIHCSGAWTLSAVHVGGHGVRVASSLIRASSAEDVAESTSCAYVSVGFGSCRTPQQGGEWEYQRTIAGALKSATGNVPACAIVSFPNELLGADGKWGRVVDAMTGTSGTSTVVCGSVQLTNAKDVAPALPEELVQAH